MATQTRQEYYDLCKSKNWPLPEIVTKDTVVGSAPNGQKLLAHDADINVDDFREVDDDGNAGPWQRAKR